MSNVNCELVLTLESDVNVLIPDNFAIVNNYPEDIFDEMQEDISTHIAARDNPHVVTKTQVGLGNVDNTSDASKPVSTATATALSGKASLGEDGKVLPDQLPAFSSTLSALTDVHLTDIVSGQGLLFDGTNWVNGVPATSREYTPIPMSYSTLTDMCVALSDASNMCELNPTGVNGLSRLEFQIMSASSTVTGNVRLDVKQGSTILVSATVPVTLAYVKQTITLPAPVTGHVDLYRDTTHVDDTLEDGGIIPAALRLFYGYEVRP